MAGVGINARYVGWVDEELFEEGDTLVLLGVGSDVTARFDGWEVSLGERLLDQRWLKVMILHKAILDWRKYWNKLGRNVSQPYTGWVLLVFGKRYDNDAALYAPLC